MATKSYRVWLLRDEFPIEAYSRSDAISQASRKYKNQNPDSKLTLSQLFCLARVKELKDYNIW